jgi:hypothetical protein
MDWLVLVIALVFIISRLKSIKIEFRERPAKKPGPLSKTKEIGS